MRSRILVSILSALIASLTLTKVAHLRKAIETNDLKRFNEVMASAKGPFESGFLSNDSGPESPANIGAALLDLSTDQKTCRDAFVETLIKFKAKPVHGGKLGMDKAAKQGCPKALEILAPLYPDDALIGGAVTTMKKFESSMETVAGGGGGVTETQIENLGNSVKFFGAKAKAKCPTFDAKNRWCNTVDEGKAL